MNKPRLNREQKKTFEKQFRTLAKQEKAKEAIFGWDGTILWDSTDNPHIPGFKKEKLVDKLAVDYSILMNRLSNGTI